MLFPLYYEQMKVCWGGWISGGSAHCCCGRCVCVWGGVGLEPYLQSIPGAGLDARPVQQHVERISDLVSASSFHTISVAL